MIKEYFKVLFVVLMVLVTVLGASAVTQITNTDIYSVTNVNATNFNGVNLSLSGFLLSSLNFNSLYSIIGLVDVNATSVRATTFYEGGTSLVSKYLGIADQSLNDTAIINAVNSSLQTEITLQAANNVTQATAITNVDTRVTAVNSSLQTEITLQANNNVSQNTKIDAVNSSLQSEITLQAANNVTQATAISNVDDRVTTLNTSKVTSVSATSPVASSGGITPVISINDDGIGDTQLAFNTGQHLTTSSNAAFNKTDIGGSFIDANGTTISGGNIWSGGNIYILGNITAFSITSQIVNGSLIPSIADTFNVGSSSVKWKDGYFSNNISAVNGLFTNIYQGGANINTIYYDSLADIQGAVTNDFHNLGGTDANTLYSAGSGLTLTTTTFALNDTYANSKWNDTAAVTTVDGRVTSVNSSLQTEITLQANNNVSQNTKIDAVNSSLQSEITLQAANNVTQATAITNVDGRVTTVNSSVVGLLSSNTTTNSRVDTLNTTKANLASPTFTGTVIVPTPFTIGAVSMTTTGTILNYLTSAGGTTGTTSTNLVFSTSPTLVTPTLGDALATTLNLSSILRISGSTLGNAALFTQTTTAGGTLGAVRNLGSASTNSPVVYFQQNNVSDDQAVMQLTQAGSGNYITAGNFSIDSTGQVNATILQVPTYTGTEIIGLGTSSTMRLLRDGSTGYVATNDAGSISIYNLLNSEDMILASPNGAVSIFFNGVKKFETVNTGVNVTGILTTTNITLANGGRVYDNATCTIILSPAGTGKLEVCN